MKKEYIILLVLFGLFMLLFIFNNNVNNVFESTSSDSKYRVIIKSKGAFLFSAEDVTIYAFKNNIVGFFKKIKYKSSIANDGKTLDKTNFDIKWNDDMAILTISGEEQDDEVLDIDFINHKISHHKIFYKVIETVGSIEKPEVMYFDYYGNKSEYLSYGVKIINEKEEDIILLSPKDFIRTLKYEKEEGTVFLKWYSNGNAYVYKGSNFTFIDCGYDRYNEDYNVIKNEYYKKYIVAGFELDYDYELCKPKQS